ncbi:HNH endonuclease [candidate division KSB1 bacterium]|nr:HNH endonuclease [candidate division KSB1 bacterium]
MREDLIGDRLQVDHIIPKAAGGATSDGNLCLACSACNRFKRHQTRARDPITGQLVRLFNPNKQNWFEHFRWSDDGILIIGRTSCGRATIVALNLNNLRKIRARKIWIRFNEHPPTK